MHISHPSAYVPGVIVHIPAFPFAERADSNPRYGLVIRRSGAKVSVRGIYTNRHPGYAPISATRGTGLVRDSYLGTRVVTFGIHQITHAIGEAPYDYDPFDDFANFAA